MFDPTHWLTGLQRAVDRHARKVVAIALATTVAASAYVAETLDFNTDTADLLAAELPWRQNYLAYKQAFPQSADTIVVVVDATTPDAAEDAATALGQRLAQQPEHFLEIFAPRDMEFLRRNAFLFLDEDALEDLTDRLAEVQPLLARLNADPSLRGLFGVMSEAAQEFADGTEVELDAAFFTIAASIDAVVRGQSQPLSWQRLMLEDGQSAEPGRVLFVVRPKFEAHALLPGKPALQALRATIADLDLEKRYGARVRLTGAAVLAHDELASVMDGALVATLACFAVVAVVLTVGLRSWWLTFATLLTLTVGLVYTAAFAAAVVGELNLISVGFAVMFLGLGTDYAIHYCMRYQELVATTDRSSALMATTAHVGASLGLCAATMAVGFYAFTPTSYVGVAQLGLISGTGMLLSLALSLTLLPALLRLGPLPPSFVPLALLTGRWVVLPARWPRSTLAGALVLAAGAIALMPRIEFDHNPVHLQDQRTESVLTYHDLLRDPDRSPLSVVAVAPDAPTARRWRDALAALPEVENVAGLDDLVAADQPAKLELIADLALTLGDALRPVSPAGNAPGLAEVETALADLDQALGRALEQNPESAPPALAALQRAVAGLAARMRGASAGERAAIVQQLQQDVLGTLDSRLARLREGLQAQAYTAEDLPPQLAQRWRTADGRERLEVFPRADLGENAELERFVAAVRSVLGEHATGDAIINLEASRSVIMAFQEAFVYSFVLIGAMLFVLLRSIRDVTMVIAPLLLAGLLTAAATVVLDMPFNFANVIVLPLLLGFGVDFGIHIVHRVRTEPPADGNVLGTSTGRAAVFAVVTNIAGIGNLAWADHIGTASMGMMLVVGLALSLLCPMGLLPALLTLDAKTRRSTP